jgi:hypothetical protein
MLSVENKPIMLNVIKLNVVMLSLVMMNVESHLKCFGKAGAYQSGVPNVTLSLS